MTTSASPSTSKGAVFARRLSSTIGLWSLVGGVVWWGHPVGFFALLIIFGVLGLREWGQMFHQWIPPVWRGWVALMSGIYAGLLWWSSGAGQTRVPLTSLMIEALMIVTLLIGLFVLVMKKPLEGETTLWRLFSAFFGFIYVPVLLSFFWRLLVFPGESLPVTGTAMPGVFYLLFMVAVTKFTDMGAYVIGSLIGKNKMIPHISPGKTWEGLIGAMVGAYLAGFGLWKLAGEKMPLLTPGGIAGLCAVLAVVTVIADLAESVIKRCLGVKDSGQMLPGIGGALDLLDSMLFTAPLIWVYLLWVK
jgi:phosphatidate cytidylyltransferase